MIRSRLRDTFVYFFDYYHSSAAISDDALEDRLVLQISFMTEL